MILLFLWTMILNKLKKYEYAALYFEQLSDLKINFHKSELFCCGQTKEYEAQYSQLFGCKVGSYPIRYWGIPMHFRKLNNKAERLLKIELIKDL